MSYAERHMVPVVTNAAGDATGYTPVVTGRIIAISYIKHGTTPYADTVDFTITSETSGQAVWAELNVVASKVAAPRQATHDTVGAAALYAAAGAAVRDHIAVAQERVKIIVAQGGDTKTGTFAVIVG